MARNQNSDVLAQDMGDYIAKMRAAMKQIDALRKAAEDHMIIHKVSIAAPELTKIRNAIEFYQGLVHTYKEAYDTLDSLLKATYGK